MRTRNGKMKFAVFLMADSNYHIAGWRHPDAYADAGSNFQRWIEFARTLERGKLDMLFVADVIGVPGVQNSESLCYASTIDKFEPFTLLAALSSVTRNIGLVATSATAYNEPYNVARTLASLDHLSGGRAGWNLVTGGSYEDAANFSQAAHAAHGDRYERGEEFVDVVRGLWGSYNRDAFSARQSLGPLRRPRQGSRPRSHRQVFFGQGTAQRWAAAAGFSGYRAGGNIRAGAQIVGAGGRCGLHRAIVHRRRQGVLCRCEGPDAAAWQASRRPESYARRCPVHRPLPAGGGRQAR
jgi:alkanesulfonate monooxygenase SsuD/methylene tetrahydromethanopterin reductase-like flavin-dependent oxidoreductase (luciferase family)